MIPRNSRPVIPRNDFNIPYTPIQLSVQPPNGDPRGRQLVTASKDGAEVHRDKVDIDAAWHRQQFLSDVQGKLRFDVLDIGGLEVELVKLGGEADNGGDGESIAPVSIGALMHDHPHLADPVIDGLLRLGETMNIIAASKVGKSWLGYGLLWSIASGRPWLGFPCRQGRVLLIDNELHPAVLANRIKTVAHAMNIDPNKFVGEFDVLSLRGRLLDLNGIARVIERLKAREYAFCLLDAFYRCLPQGASENDNATVAGLFNTIDGVCRDLGCSWANIHHSSKGAQQDKSVVDVGAGAGAQSRAADCHVVLRPHEDDGVIVMEGVVRSFKPVAPLALRWEFPLWHPADDVDPAMLKGRGTKGDEKKRQEDKEAADRLIDALRHAEGKQLTRKKAMAASKVGETRFDRMVYQLEKDKHITSEVAIVSSNKTTIYQLIEGG